MAKTVPIILDKERNLLLDFNGIADAAEVGGEGVNRFITGQSADFHGMRALFWAGLKHEDPKLTVHATGALIQERIEAGEGIPELAAKIWLALIAAGMGKKKEDAEKNSQPETRVLDS